jgi:hypothetical protein
VVAVFGRRVAGVWPEADRIRLSFMIELSLGALLFSILPLILHHLGTDPQATWAISSVLLASFFVGFGVVAFHRIRGRHGQQSSGLILSVTILHYLIMGAAVVALSVNVIRGAEFGLFLLGLGFLLLESSIQFARLLFTGVAREDT